MIAKFSDFKTRKMLADGIFMSKMVYLICIWSNCSKDLLTRLQSLQNKAALIVTRNYRYNNSQENLKQSGWLSVKQLIFYHKVVQLHKIRETKLPESLFKMYEWNYTYPTRQEAKGLIKPIGTPRLRTTQSSFRWSAAQCFNSLPQKLTLIKEGQKFKGEVKAWITENVPYK